MSAKMSTQSRLAHGLLALHSMNIKKMFKKLNTTRRVPKPKVVECANSSESALDVCAHVKSYMLETSELRNENHVDLFLSWAIKTMKPVTKVSTAKTIQNLF